MRILLLALTLTACSCSTAPIAKDAQRDITSLLSAYDAARNVEREYEALPPCPALKRCADADLAYQAKRADYQAAAAITTADSERTAATIAEARAATQAFVAAALELQ